MASTPGERKPHVLVALKVSEFDASGALVNEITLEQRGGTGSYIETVKRLVAAIGGQ